MCSVNWLPTAEQLESPRSDANAPPPPPPAVLDDVGELPSPPRAPASDTSADSINELIDAVMSVPARDSASSDNANAASSTADISALVADLLGRDEALDAALDDMIVAAESEAASERSRAPTLERDTTTDYLDLLNDMLDAHTPTEPAAAAPPTQQTTAALDSIDSLLGELEELNAKPSGLCCVVFSCAFNLIGLFSTTTIVGRRCACSSRKSSRCRERTSRTREKERTSSGTSESSGRAS